MGNLYAATPGQNPGVARIYIYIYIYIYTVDNRLFIDDYMGLGIITIHYRKSYLPANIKGRNVGFWALLRSFLKRKGYLKMTCASVAKWWLTLRCLRQGCGGAFSYRFSAVILKYWGLAIREPPKLSWISTKAICSAGSSQDSWDFTWPLQSMAGHHPYRNNQ